MWRTRRARSIVAACVLAAAGTAVPLHTSAASAPQDASSDTVVLARLLAEARDAARRAPDPQRASLLERIVREQSRLQDFAEAERTLSLLPAQGSSPDTVTVMQRAGLQVLCGLLDVRRDAAAAQFVERVRSAGDRDWLRAWLASQVAKGRGTPYTATPRSEDVEARTGRALEIARGVSASPARADALVAIARAAKAHPASQARVAREAVAAVEHLADPRLRAARSAMLVEPLLESGELALARRQFDGLQNPEDRAYVGWRLILRVLPDTTLVRHAARDSLRDSLLRSVIADAARTRAAPASASLLRGFRDLLLQEKRTALADSLVPDSLAPRASEPAIEKTRDRGASPRADSSASNAVREARRWIDRAQTAYSLDRDTVAAYLALARTALSGGGVDSATFDATAARIAQAQFRFGLDDAGVATLDLLHDARTMRYLVAEWIGSSHYRLSAQQLSELANRVRRPALREQMLLGLLGGYLLAKGSTPAERRWGIALADSLGVREPGAEALMVLADDALSRGDSARARTLYRSALRSSDFTEPISNRSPEQGLEKAGGHADLLAWARSEERPAARSERLLRIAEIVQARIEARRRTITISMGPDGCRDEF
jgi:hypothetical protein